MGTGNNDAARKAAIERLTLWVHLADGVGAVGAVIHEALLEDDGRSIGGYTESEPAAAAAELLIELLGEHRAKQRLGEVELSADQVDALGLDSSGTDGNERFPYTGGNLTADERQRLTELME